MKKSLSTTYCYNMLNKDQIINKNLKSIIDNGKTISKENILLPYEAIRTHFNTNMKPYVLNGINDGSIKLLYTKNIKMPISLPYVTIGSKDGMFNIIFIDLFSNYNEKTDILNIETAKLYTLCESALVAKGLLRISNPSHLNREVIKNGAKLYSALFTRILNKAYALNTNKLKLDRVIFGSACFYLINILGFDMMKQVDLIKNYAMQCCNNPNKIILDQFYNDMINNGNPFEDISGFIQTIASIKELELKDLGVRNYISSFISTYGSSMLLALESLEYLFYNVSSVVNKAFLNNGNLFIATVGEKDVVTFYNGVIESITDNI